MRISSQQIFEAGIQSIQDHSGEAMKYQTQISSGKKYTQISDNPQAVTLGLKLSFDKAQYDMYSTNQQLMVNRLDNTTNQLSSIYTALASLKQTVIQAQGVSSQTDLAALAQKAKSLNESILQYSSAKDASNHPILTPLLNTIDSLTLANNDVLGTVQIEPGIFINEGISLSESMGVFTDIHGIPDITATDSRYVNVLQAAQNISDALHNGNQPSAGDVTLLNDAITQVTAAQVKTGLMSKQVTSAQDSVSSNLTNLEDTRSTLLDTDIAEASAGLARSQTLLQAAQSIFAKMQSSTLFEKL